MNKITILVFLISVFFLSFLPVKDTDFGWHYRCGNQFLTTGKLCLKNEFSYFLPNYKAYNPSFLYDITLAFVYNHFGFLGVSFLGALISTLSAIFILKLFSCSTWLRIVVFYLIFWLSYSTFGLGLRSQMVSYLFFVITFFVLTKKSVENRNWLNREWRIVIENRKKKLENQFPISVLLPFLFLIWVNTHIGFFLGPILLGIFAVSNLSISFLRKQESSNSGSLIKLEEKPPRLDTINNDKTSEVNQVYGQPSGLSLQLFGFVTFNFLAAFLNPFGPKVYLEILRHFQAPLNTMIAEWVAPSFWQKVLIIISAMVGFVINVGVDQRVDPKRGRHIGLPLQNKSRLFNILLLLFFTLLALQARRNLPFFYTIFFYVFLQYSKFSNDRYQKWNDLIISFLLSIFVISFSLPSMPATIRFDISWNDYCQKSLITYPCQALEKTNLKQLSGNLYTAYEWGGFLIWQTPDLKVFTDGRMSAWKSEKEPYPGSGQYSYQVYLYIIQARKGWQEILKKYQTDYLLIGNGTFLDLELQKNAAKYGWKENYRDEVAVFYKKN